MRTRIVAAALASLAILVSPSAANAQGEFGLGIGGAAILPPFADGGGGSDATLWSVHVGGRVGPKFHVEGSFDKMRGCPEICAMYAIGVKQDLATVRETTGVFVTYGLAGSYIHEPSHEYRYQTSDGHEYVTRSASREDVNPPFIPVGGIGLERKLFGPVSWRLDLQGYVAFVVPIAIRASAGFTIPFGR
ncbi:MAG TPA: hypothetical protein VI258_09125 [Rhodanobacteraceae bacterium]